MQDLQNDIQQQLRELDSELDLVAVEQPGKESLRLFIDHPSGVDLALCEKVTKHLNNLRAEYSLEVSSPGQDRPLTKPQHYTRFLGRRARVRLRGDGADRERAPDSKRQVNLTGELVGASELDITIAAGDGVVTIPYERIARSNLIPGD